MVRKQEEAAENAFKSPRFFPSAGKERREKVPKRARGENKGQIRARGKKDKERNSENSYKEDHQCDPEGTCVSKPLLPKLGGAWSQDRAAEFSHCHSSAPAAGGQPS